MRERSKLLLKITLGGIFDSLGNRQLSYSLILVTIKEYGARNMDEWKKCCELRLHGNVIENKNGQEA